MPKLVFALENDYEGPRYLNDDNTLGLTSFAYSTPYTIAGLDYIDEFFTAPNGIMYARVLFINNLEAAQELSSQRYYYKLAEVIPYPAIPGLFVNAVHENAAFNPWILQNWIIAKEIQDIINMEQWRSIQNFMRQNYKNERAAEKAYKAGMAAAKAKRDLKKTQEELNKLKIENQEIKAKLKLTEQAQQEDLKAAKKPSPPATPKLSKAQKQKIRRDDILHRASRISALATMATQTTNKILNLLRDLDLNEANRILLTENLEISIEACGYLLKVLHKKDYISKAVKQAFMYKFVSFTDDELFEYAKDNSTQQLVTMTFELSTDQTLRNKIQWHNDIHTIKLNHTKLLAELRADITQKEQLKVVLPESQLQEAILDLKADEYIEILKKHPDLNKKTAGIFKNLLPTLSTAKQSELKQFLDTIKLSKDIWLDIYTDPTTNGAVKSVTEEWAEAETTAMFESMSRKIKPIKITQKALYLFHNKTNSDCQTLLMIAIEKSYPDEMLEQIFLNTSPSEILSIDIADQTLLHYLGLYKGSNYDLIKRIRDAFIKAVDDAKQHGYEMVHMKSDKDGGTFLHYILRGESEQHACKMMQLFFNDTLPPKWLDIFRSVVFEKNQKEETVATTLDLKDSEWRSARRLLYTLIPDLIFDYKFADDYKYFFLTEGSCTKLIELVFSDPLRVIEIFDARTRLQHAGVSKMTAILKKTPADVLQQEEVRLRKAMKYLNFEVHEATMVPGTEMNIHRMLSQKICTEYDKELEKKYNDSIFYKTYNNIAIGDTLLWSKFTHAFRVWQVKGLNDIESSECKKLNDAAMALITYLMKNTDKTSEVIECFFDQNESPVAFALFMKLSTRSQILGNFVYNEFFKFIKHRKFCVLFIRLCKEINGPETAIFVRQVVQFASQSHLEFGLLLSLLNYKNSNDVTKELLANINKYFNDYDTFLTIALDQDNTFLICNLLCQRDAETGRLTMQALCRIATARQDFEKLYKILEMTKSSGEHRNWDPEADFLNLLFATAAKSKSLETVETLITRFKPTITAGIILAISDSESNNNEPIYQKMMSLITDAREKQISAAKTETPSKDTQTNAQESHIIRILKRKDKLVA